MQNNVIQQTSLDTISTCKVVEGSTDVYEMVEEMPRFLGCEEMEGSIADKKHCADKKMLAYINANINRLTIPDEEDVEGVTVIRFIIDEQGKVIEPFVLREAHPVISKTYLSVINKMPKWIAGKCNGEPVKVQFNLPIHIRFDK